MHAHMHMQAPLLNVGEQMGARVGPSETSVGQEVHYALALFASSTASLSEDAQLGVLSLPCYPSMLCYHICLGWLCSIQRSTSVH